MIRIDTEKSAYLYHCIGISAAVCQGPAHTKHVDHEHVFWFWAGEELSDILLWRFEEFLQF